jgi:putative tricarboxylic transport membrane protein
VLALAALLAWQTALIPEGGSYAEVGPRAAPWFVTALLALLGLAICIARPAPPDRATGAATNESSAADRVAAERLSPDRIGIDRLAFAWMGAGLVLHLLLIGHAGFVIATTALFTCTARAFGSTRIARDAGIGLLLAVAAHLVFARLLHYGLGDGIVERFL